MEVGIDGSPLIVANSELAMYCEKLVNNIAHGEEIHVHMMQNTHLCQELPKYIHLYHCMNNGISIQETYKSPIVCTIHTMLPYTHPHLCQRGYTEAFFKAMTYHQTHQTTLLATSQTLRNELSYYLGRDKQTIGLIELPLEPMYRPIVFELGGLWVRDRWGVDGPFMLYMGDCHKRKQLVELLNFFKAFKAREPNLKLVIAMPTIIVQRDYMEEVKRLVLQKSLEREIYFLRELHNYDRLYLYQGAKCFLDFSVDSSLNTYMLEAKACGCPVVCSDTPLHHELLGENGIYIDLQTMTYPIEQEDFGITLPTLERKASKNQTNIEGGKLLSDIYREVFE